MAIFDPPILGGSLSDRPSDPRWSVELTIDFVGVENFLGKNSRRMRLRLKPKICGPGRLPENQVSGAAPIGGSTSLSLIDLYPDLSTMMSDPTIPGRSAAAICEIGI